MTHGRGTLTTPQGWQVKGEIKDGEGIGTLLVYYETEEKELYFGEVENSKRHGSGTLIMQRTGRMPRNKLRTNVHSRIWSRNWQNTGTIR